MLNEANYYLATAAAQGILSRAVKIDVDGKWGSFTQSAYDQAPADLKKAVDVTVRTLAGSSVSDLRDYREAQRRLGNSRIKTLGKLSSSAEDVRRAITAYAEREGVPAQTALKIAWLESRFNPKATSPTGAKGVFQLTSIAIKDVAQRGGYQVRDPYDMIDNIVGGLKYLKIVSRDLGVSLSDAPKLYMGFNIGPTGAKYVLSGKPELAAKQIGQQAYGKPAVYAENLTKAVNSALA